MIYGLKGKLAIKKNTEIIIDVNGIYYQVFISLTTMEKLPKLGEEIFINIIQIIREDSHSLYGFYDQNEKEVFKLLLDIKNIGPKTALGILSAIKPEDLIRYVSEANTGMLAKLPGIGKKTAERLHIELKDKIDKFIIDNPSISGELANTNNEAVSALVTLGFNRNIALKAVNTALKDPQATNVENIIKIALKNVMK